LAFAVVLFVVQKPANLISTLHNPHLFVGCKIAQIDACIFGEINYNQLKLPGITSTGSPGENVQHFLNVR
jgi:hypothetical protein